MSLVSITFEIIKKRAKEYALFATLFTLLFSLLFISTSWLCQRILPQKNPLAELVQADLWIIDQDTKDLYAPNPVNLEKIGLIYQIREFQEISPVFLEKARFFNQRGGSIDALLLGLGHQTLLRVNKIARGKGVVSLFGHQKDIAKESSYWLPLGATKELQEAKKKQLLPIVVSSFEGALTMCQKKQNTPSAFVVKLKHPKEAKKIAQIVQKLTNLKVLLPNELTNRVAADALSNANLFSLLTVLAVSCLLIAISVFFLETFTQKIFSRFSLIVRLGALPSKLVISMVIHYSLLLTPAILASLTCVMLIHMKDYLQGFELGLTNAGLILSLGGGAIMLALHFAHSWNMLIKEER